MQGSSNQFDSIQNQNIQSVNTNADTINLDTNQSLSLGHTSEQCDFQNVQNLINQKENSEILSRFAKPLVFPNPQNYSEFMEQNPNVGQIDECNYQESNQNFLFDNA